MILRFVHSKCFNAHREKMKNFQNANTMLVCRIYKKKMYINHTTYIFKKKKTKILFIKKKNH